MRIESCSGNSPFTSLYRGVTIKKAVANNKELKPVLERTERILRKNNMHKKENVDIILNYTERDGFYGVISSKEQGVPMCPGYRCKVSDNKTSIDNFIAWANEWNTAYSREELDKMKNLMTAVKNYIKTNR